MELEHLCKNCMNGLVMNGICGSCGKAASEPEIRPSYALPAGYMLCRQYYLGRVLGSGGFGITYLAWDVRNNRRVAVKELFLGSDMVRDNQTRNVQIKQGQENYFAHMKKRFLEEAQILYEFSNVPDITDVYHMFQENGTAYYAMEFLEGMDLKLYLRKNGTLSWERLSVYVRMILRALSALHSRSFIHRDISPDNIFLTKDGHAKLIDFGSLRCYNSGKGLTTILKQQFAPYEQYRSDGKQGPWTDIYSLSVTMYYALSGVLIPKAPDRLQGDSVTFLSELVPSLPRHVAYAIEKGMAVMAEKRYQTVDAFYEALFRGEKMHGTTQTKNEMRYMGKVVCINGMFSGKSWGIAQGGMLSVGRDKRCQIVYPPNTPGISRMQCSFIYHENGNIYVRDENSTYGTFVNGNRLTPGTWYMLSTNSVVGIAQEKYRIQSRGEKA